MWFCSEFLDRVQNELERMKDVSEAKATSHMSSIMEGSKDVVGQMFQGELVSEVGNDSQDFSRDRTCHIMISVFCRNCFT